MADKNPTRSYRLSTQDATFVYGETQNAPLHIGSILIFDGRIDFERFLRHIEERLHLVPRYRQRVAAVPLNLSHALMEDDPAFRIENHVLRHVLPSGLNENDALDEMMRHYEQPLDFKRPLWEMHSFENLDDGRTAVVSKVHHALVDGVSGVELLKVMFDLKPNPDPIEPPAAPWEPQRPSSALHRMIGAMGERTRISTRRLRESARELMRDPEGAADEARMLALGMRHIAELGARRIASTPWNSGIVGQRRALAWTRHSFGDFRAIRNAFGGSLNDVVLTILSEGAARYLHHHGYNAAGQKLSIGCPVNVRHKEEQSSLGNRVSMMFPALPAEPVDVVERLKLVNQETERIKAAGYAQALERLMALGDLLPPALIGPAARVGTFSLDAASMLFRVSGYKPRPDRFLFPAMAINFIATNVPGVLVPQYVLGHQCRHQIPLVPLGASLGYGVAILSYNQAMYFGLSADPNLLPDVALMKYFVDEAFGELRQRCHAGEAPLSAAAVAAG